MAGHFGHKGGWRHARLGIHFQPDNFTIFGEPVVVTEVGPTDPTTTNCLMRP